jgi:hypothetical protein
VSPAAASYCASGLVLWHDSEVQLRRAYVSSWGQSGLDMLVLSFTGFDPFETWAAKTFAAQKRCSCLR